MSEVKNQMDIANYLWDFTPPMAASIMDRQSFLIGAMEAVKYMRNHPENDSYNSAIEDVLSVVKVYNTGKELSPLFDQLIPKIEGLKK